MTAKIIAPATVKAGAAIPVSGSGWGWRYYVYISLDAPYKIGSTDTSKLLATVKTTSSKGAFSATIPIPAGITPGTHQLYAVSRRPAVAMAPLIVEDMVVDPPPVISGIIARNITQSAAEFAWHVSEKAQGWIEVGPTTAYGTETRHETTLNYSDHVQGLTGLLPGTLYHYRIHAIDAAGQHVTSADQTFTTQGSIIVPPPPPPPPVGQPAMAPDEGDLLRKDFRDGIMAPFRPLTYVPASDLMRKRGDFYADHASIVNGVLELRCDRPRLKPAQQERWRQSFVGTGTNFDGKPIPFSYSYGLREVALAMNIGKGAWGGFWDYSITGGTPEIDQPEAISMKLTANYRPGPIQFASRQHPGNGYHVYSLRREPGRTTVYFDGVEDGHVDKGFADQLGLLIDNKIGLQTDDDTTPDLWVRVLWVRVAKPGAKVWTPGG